MNQPTKRKKPSAKNAKINQTPDVSSSEGVRKPTKMPKQNTHRSTTSKHSNKSLSSSREPLGQPARTRTPRNAELSQTPYIWTRDSKGPSKDAAASPALPRSGTVSGFFRGLGRALANIAAFFWSYIRRSRIAIAITMLLFVLLFVGLVDTAANWGKIYSGVKVGTLDLSNKSVEEARELIEDTYEPRLMGTDVKVLSSEEALKNLDATIDDSQNTDLIEQKSIESLRNSHQLWTTDAALLSASLDAKGLVDDAVSYGRENGGIFNRMQAFIFGYTIAPRATYSSPAVEALAADIDQSVGSPRVNYNIQVVNGVASVTEGHDGHMINRESFKMQLDDAFFSTDQASVYRVAQMEYAPLQIDREAAQKTSDLVNGSIQYGVLFYYEGTSWDTSGVDIGSWVSTRVVAKDNHYILQPFIDYSKAKSVILSHLKVVFSGSDVKVSFLMQDDVPMVEANTKGVIPLASNAVDDLNALLFPAGASAPTLSSQPSIKVAAGDIPTKLTVQESLDYGIITNISSFTTEFSTNAPARNHNIHLVADRLNNSIVDSDSGIWSFNGIAGNCNAEAGFQGAGAIVDGEYVDEIGGGICQVATTVFNAVYNSGFPVTERHNHSLFIASYPAGKDAAVSWPDLDLKWKNDSTSDVLVKMTYTDSSVTATLYGQNPGYQVSTEAGEWVAGEKFKSKTLVDSTLPVNTTKIKTEGTDGKKITIVRTVKDYLGKVRHQQTFTSQYDPKTEIRLVSTDKKDEATKEEGQ